MIEYEKIILRNGLKVIFHKDISTPLVHVNVLYNVGARDEHPDKTGFAHLFEHLMFGGSVNIPNYDTEVEHAGGENNAFTSNDITNYYITLPKENIETAFWLESDRMLELKFSEKSLEVQKNVVIEEFKQRYLNQPYGDLWLLLRPLAYQVHPYQWATIGKDISHIENATLEDVKNFFFHHYAPNNAILSVAGNIQSDTVFKLAEKWFGPVEKRDIEPRNLPKEPVQKSARMLRVKKDVPVDCIYKVYPMCSRLSKKYHTTDLISDILANGNSSRLYQKLIKENPLFSQINSYIMGSFDEGLLVITGKTKPGIKIETADQAIKDVLNELVTGDIQDDELEKVKNKVESNLVFSETQALNKAMSLAQFELLSDASDMNREVEKYRQVTKENMKETAGKLFREKNSTTLYYLSKTLNP